MLERNDLGMTPRDPFVIAMSKAFEPIGLARDDYEIFTAIADKLDIKEEFTEGRSAADWLEWIWDQSRKNTKKTGIGLVGVKNSGHYGLSGYYVEQAVKKNLMVWCFTNAPPAIAPYGAKKTLFGTNPICFGTPSGGKVPFILDTSVSMINRGIIRVAARLGKKIPAGVALDKNGNPTTDAKKALKGVQLPIAGFRGSGLAWMVDILSGVITGAAHGGKVRDPFDDFRGPQNVGHLFLAIKPNIFIGKNYIKRIKENIRIIKKLPRAKGFASISYPGENKAKRFSKNFKKKIYLPKEIEKDLKRLIGASSK